MLYKNMYARVCLISFHNQVQVCPRDTQWLSKRTKATSLLTICLLIIRISTLLFRMRTRDKKQFKAIILLLKLLISEFGHKPIINKEVI